MPTSSEEFKKLINDLDQGIETKFDFPDEVTQDEYAQFLRSLDKNIAIKQLSSFRVKTLDNPLPLLNALKNKPNIGHAQLPPFALTVLTAGALARIINTAPNLTILRLQITGVETGSCEIIHRSLARHQKFDRLFLEAFKDNSPIQAESADLISLFQLIRHPGFTMMQIKGFDICDDSAEFFGSIINYPAASYGVLVSGKPLK